MTDWTAFVEGLVKTKSVLDSIEVRLNEDQYSTGFPLLVKATELLIAKMHSAQVKSNPVVVFPERTQTAFLFVCCYILNELVRGKTSGVYDPFGFSPGDRLKLHKAIVEFLGNVEVDGKPSIRLRLSDMVYTAPIDFLPHFQRTKTRIALSGYDKFKESRNYIESIGTSDISSNNALHLIAERKTHLSQSILFVSTLKNATESLTTYAVNGQRLIDLIMVAKADYTGRISNISPGMLAGIPALILCSDLYSAEATVSGTDAIHSIILDISDSNSISNQLDALDRILNKGITVICVTDMMNSFDLQPFEDRGFWVWRWHDANITKNLYNSSSLLLEKRIKNLVNNSVQYLTVQGGEISTAIRKISLHRNASREFSTKLMKMYENLSNLTFNVLRETVPLSSGQIAYARSLLEESMSVLAKEEQFTSEVVINDLLEVINNLNTIYSENYQLLKNQILSQKLQTAKYQSVCLIIPEKADKERTLEYWQTWCKNNNIASKIHVCYPSEYGTVVGENCSATIVTGWLKRAIMKRILFSFITQTYVVILNEYEVSWKDYSRTKWSNELKRHNNSKVLRSASDKHPVYDPPSSVEKAIMSAVAAPPLDDELNDIEKTLRENRYGRYIVNKDSKQSATTSEAVPVNFVGGFMAFYKVSHKVVTATRIIASDADSIDFLTPDKLTLGDFVVVRDSKRDIIREMADIVLLENKKPTLRYLASIWKEALEIEKIFSTPEQIYQKLQQSGCKRGYMTVRSWLFDDDIIAPQDKEDLLHIAVVTDSQVLYEKLESVESAASEVRAAHVAAGKRLSELLRKQIAEAIVSYGTIDPFNIWEPITLAIEGIGLVRILKIIDIGSKITVDNADTNRLIEEQE